MQPFSRLQKDNTRLVALTEEERKARKYDLEEEQHRHRLRNYHSEVQNLIYAIAFLIKCIAFYIAAKGVEVLYGILLKHGKFTRGIRD